MYYICQSLSKEEKKKQQYGREQYENLSEDGKPKLVMYQKKCYKMKKKMPHYNYKKLLFQKNYNLESSFDEELRMF